ncbi:peptidase domain-containing ABC transporter [Carboxylicivirga linearis]|uniref:Peptidase domain-containing ABC transporter n=1 Tax=Carboxylicivirga linearis TaxID=1628157 RepID=A0ABS5JY05_9BACT|nr:peptidase domain-containing ABC transporter [Carboxylicivirga linearis]MBS2099756.1 peptidase domain-containing ABC transporter [Carboxylicivirga linearis]
MSIKVQQYDHADCGAACLASVASFYKLKLRLWKIRELAGTNLSGTSAYGILKAAETIGFEAKGIQISKDDLPEIPLPSIAHLKLPEGGHHYVVIYKVGKRKIKIMDPAEGRLINMPLSNFIDLWTGITILLIPSIDFQQGVHKESAAKKLWNLVRPHNHILLQSGIGALAFSTLGISTAIYIQKLTDFVLVGHNINLLNLMGILMILVIIFQLLLGMLQSWFVLQVGQNIDSTLITGYFQHLLKLPQRFFDSMRVGELISRVNDAIKIRNFINQVAVEATVDLLIILVAFLVMAIINWKLSLLTLTVTPIYVLVFLLTNKANRKIERDKMKKTAKLEVQLVESLKAAKTIKQMGAEDYFIAKTETRLMEVLEEVYRSGKVDILSSYNLLSINRLITIAILWIGALSVINQQLTPGQLMSFFAITSFFTGPVSRLLGMNKTIQGAVIATDRLFEILDLKRETDDRNSYNKLEELIIGDIKFKDVEFQYTLEQELFKNLSFTINKGCITALVGDSGSGKSTIGYLLQGLYPISSGAISIGHADINNVEHTQLRKAVGVVPQNIELFAGNLIENIALGDYSPDMNRIYEIIDLLNLHDIIDNLPEGLNTWLGENANQLSGGQRQRLAIARMLYLNPEIYVFDEATSFLDDRTETGIKNLILDLKKKGKTIIMVAHRMSTINIAEQILVFEKGKVIESGNYNDLISLNGRFFEMVQHHRKS